MDVFPSSFISRNLTGSNKYGLTWKQGEHCLIMRTINGI